ncbi:MarR family winged helix-turn-helix transcriptional regulator [Streptomyces sp. NPDC014734]|uniref:MarR family winged helix-turn-helix transcriptional regulator n=1 Tax=Streptomyces sp. NPDC014734 TaxID=3364886 RepID=UPI003701A557
MPEPTGNPSDPPHFSRPSGTTGTSGTSEPSRPSEPLASSGGPAPEQVAQRLTAVIGRLLRRLRTTSSDSLLTPTQRSVLSRLDREGPATTAALARAEFVRPQSMRLTLGALEAQGLVGRAPDPADGRKSVMSITGSGLAVLTAVRAAKNDWLAEAIAAELDDEERRTLVEAADLLGRLVGK